MIATVAVASFVFGAALASVAGVLDLIYDHHKRQEEVR